MMTLKAEEALHHFQQSAANYFEKEVWSSLEIEQPIISLAYEMPRGVFGWVKISGLASGWVIFSAPEEMVSVLVREKVGELKEGDCEDYMREMASVIVSNCRRELGADLKVEIPDHAEVHNPESFLKGKAVFVVSMKWRGHLANMVIALEKIQD
jgi:Chemotaxis phosphatase CheX